MIYEKRLGSLAAMKAELERLDGDAGMRVSGKYGGVACFAFVTRFGSIYTVLVCSTGRGRGKGPGKLLKSREFNETGGLVAFLKAIAGAKVEAVVY